MQKSRGVSDPKIEFCHVGMLERTRTTFGIDASPKCLGRSNMAADRLWLKKLGYAPLKTKPKSDLLIFEAALTWFPCYHFMSDIILYIYKTKKSWLG